MIFRKTAIILFSLLIFLSGCSLKTPVDIVESKNREEVQNIQTGASTTELDKGGEEVFLANNDDKIEDSDRSINDDGIVKIIPMAQLPELTLEPQTPLTKSELEAIISSSMLTPMYFDTFRYQVREFSKNPSRLVLDIGNTSEKTIVIKDENLNFSLLDRDGNEIAGSKLQDAPISIPAGQVKRVVLTASHNDASYVSLNLNGIRTALSYPMHYEEGKIVDTIPYDNSTTVFTTEDLEGVKFLVGERPRELIGNGMFKAMVNGLMVVENNKIGSVEKGDGFIALAKVKMANTSQEEMKIEKIISSSEGILTNFTEKDMVTLGKEGMPFIIKPNEIVEGYVPIKMGPREIGPYGIVFYTSNGNFLFQFVQTYTRF